MKNKIFFTFSSIALPSLIVVSQVLTVSCSSIEAKQETEEINNNINNNLLKEQQIINILEDNSKLDKEERKYASDKQKDYYASLSLNSINQFLLDNANMTLNEYFINLNTQNKLNSTDSLYIDPSLGIMLVDDILNGQILFQDILDTFGEFKENNHQQYINDLEQLNLTETQVDDLQNIKDLIATDKEDENIDNNFDQINKDDIENPEEPVEVDELFKLNEKYSEGQRIYIDFKREGNFFEYCDPEKLENIYIDDYDLYFNSPITVTIELNDKKTKIEINNFDISELEIYWYREGFLDWNGVTEIKYNDKQIYKFSEGGWRDGYRNISSMYFTFHKLINKINDDDSKIVNKIDNNVFNLSIDKQTYDFVQGLEQKILSLKNYITRSEILNTASFSLSVIAIAVATSWTVAAFFTFGATSAAAAAAILQATTLTLSTTLTNKEIQNNKRNLEKYLKFYNSNEYDILLSLINQYSDGRPILFDKNSINIMIQFYFEYYSIWKFSGEIVKYSNLKIFKLANEMLNRPKEVVYSFEIIKSIVEKFRNRFASQLEKLSIKISKKIFEKMPIVMSKTINSRWVCISTAWANPIGLIIDAFDIVLTAISIVNDLFSDTQFGRYYER